MLITDVLCAISGVDPRPLPELDGDEGQVIQDLAEVAKHDHRQELPRVLPRRDRVPRSDVLSCSTWACSDWSERAQGESLFWTIACKAVRYSKTAKFVADEFVELESRLHDKYICNFSVFQSLPDHWALDQLFPVMPIHRLDEAPTRRATLVDITCDSDGEVDKFVDRREIKGALEVHELVPGQPYYLAFLLLGAYQDTMGDLHNLFGRVHEVEVVSAPAGGHAIRRVLQGEPAVDALRWFGYREDELVAGIERALSGRVERGLLDAETSRGLLSDYRARLRRYTYLD